MRDKNFSVYDGVLTDYEGPGGDVVVPDEVTVIKPTAFYQCKALTGITIPYGVTKIEPCTFNNLQRLARVNIPGSVTHIGDSAFANCSRLTSITIPEGVTHIGKGAFEYCKRLTNVTISSSVTSIGASAFEGCTKLIDITIPDSVKKIGEYAFDGTGVSKERMIEIVMNGCVVEGPGDRGSMLHCVEFAAAVRLTSGNARVLERYEPILYKNAPGAVAAMIQLLQENKCKPISYKRAAEFAVSCGASLETEDLQALYRVLTDAKAKAAVEILEPVIKQGDSVKRTNIHPVESFCRGNFPEGDVFRVVKKCGLKADDLPAVRYRDSEESAPPYVLGCLLALWMEAEFEMWPFEPSFPNRKKAEQIADGLNIRSLQEALETLRTAVEEKKGIVKAPEFMFAYCRYASPKQLKSVISNLDDWYSQKGGRSAEVVIGYAICLNDCREALLWADKTDNMLFAASLRNTTVTALRESMLSEFGLDENGEKVYDLGGNTVTARLENDLTITLFDGNAQKEVKSMPKKKADPEKFEIANADFSDMKRNLKKAAKECCKQCFQDFLEGETKKAEEWKASYMNNSLLRQIASLLVWSQAGKTFTLSGKQAIDSKGQPFEFNDKRIGLAHPMEMERDDVERWQKYFAVHAIKQPFAQVWEPLVDFNSIKEDRYSNVQLPAYRLMYQDKHGIKFDYDYGTSELTTSFSDCELECEFVIFQRHELDRNVPMKFGSLRVKKASRRANHVLGLLVQWTAAERVKKDDVSVTNILDMLTLAQITSLLDLAVENNCTNCTAALLEYKNARFADFSNMKRFTLD